MMPSKESPACPTDCPTDCPNRLTKIRILDKGFSYLLGCILVLTLAVQATIKTDDRGEIYYSFSTRDLPWPVVVLYSGLIGAAFGLPMDRVAYFFGSVVCGKRE